VIRRTALTLSVPAALVVTLLAFAVDGYRLAELKEAP
jgi:hypothetical protein